MLKKIICLIIIILLIQSSAYAVFGKNSIHNKDNNKYLSYYDGVPTWEIGDSWTYNIDDITISDNDSTLEMIISFEDFLFEVIDDSQDSYNLKFESNIHIIFTASFDIGSGPIEITVELGRLINSKIIGEISYDKNNLGIKDFSFEISGILRIKLLEQPFIKLPIPALYIPFKIDLSAKFSNPFVLLDFPIDIDKTWGTVESAFSIDSGIIKCPWFRPINFIHKIIRFFNMIPPAYQQQSDVLNEILPIINIIKTIELFGFNNSIVLPAYDALFYCKSYETIETQAGIFNVYNISLRYGYLDLIYIYYSPNVGNIVKININEDIFEYLEYYGLLQNIKISNISIELIETTFS